MVWLLEDDGEAVVWLWGEGVAVTWLGEGAARRGEEARSRGEWQGERRRRTRREARRKASKDGEIKTARR